VVGTRDPAVLSALPPGDDRLLIDLIHLPDAEARRADSGYHGLAW
jgi:GDP-mannose 6-dehydrogenase